MLTTELKSLVVSVTPLVVDGFNKEEIVKLAKGIVEHKFSLSIIVDFISIRIRSRLRVRSLYGA
jgi:hypothetical protein